MTTVATLTSEPDDNPGDDAQQRISRVLAALERAWRRNPNKTLNQIVARAASYTTSFIPDDVSDTRMEYGFHKLGPGPVSPTPPGSEDEAHVLAELRRVVDEGAQSSPD